MIDSMRLPHNFLLCFLVALLFRTEFFNSFNSPQFDLPGGTLGNSTFGVVTGTRSDSRQIQFALKYLW